VITIDGSEGEGGGQVLRTSLALSLITRQPLRLVRIRARRRKPGLRAQHLTCVQAAQAVGRAEVQGARLGSVELTFRPHALQAGDYRFDLGTAGSTSLVLQTVLPALLHAEGPSTLSLRGGTHNPLAPPFEFLERVYAPLVARLGGGLEAELVRPGFYPKGGGEVRYRILPGKLRSDFELLEPGPLESLEACAYLAGLPDHVAQRELDAVADAFDLPPTALRVVRPRRPRGPGNALLITLRFARATEVVSAYGEKRKRAESVASGAIAEARRVLEANVPVGEHGADQLLLLLALAGGGRFQSVAPSGHTTTQMALIPRFLPHVRLESTSVGADRCELSASRSY
jgi:RNA 3'-terminal phosphate cyclase (ATP)